MEKFLTLCMIVKNEENVLNRCLMSIHSLVDEIIIIDTGSVDNTVEIASRYTDKIFHFKWTEDFSEARNYAGKFATSKWIIYLDADEYVDKENFVNALSELKKSLESNDKIDAFVVNQINFLGDFSNSTGVCPTTRLYKNKNNIKFKRKIHEQLHKDEGILFIEKINLNIFHTGYNAENIKDKNKSERNLKLITQEIENSKNAFDYYNLGNEYLAIEDTNKALEYYHKAYLNEKNKEKLWIPLNVERLIYCLIEVERFAEALKIANEAITTWSNIVDFKTQKALIMYLTYERNESLIEFENIVNSKDLEILSNYSYKNFIPFRFLGELYEEIGNVELAVYNYSKAAFYNKEDIGNLSRFYNILSKNVNHNDFIEFVDKNVISNDIDKSRLLKILLDKGEVILFKKIIEYYNIKYSDSINFKINLISNKYNIAQLIYKKTSLNDLLNDGWTDKYDIFILYLITGKENILEKLNNHTEVFYESNDVKHTFKEKDFLNLLDKCISYGKFELIDKIFNEFNLSEYSESIGNLFFENNFKEIALDIYLMNSEKHLKVSKKTRNKILNYIKEEKNDFELMHWKDLFEEKNINLNKNI